LAHNYAKLTT